MIDGLREAYVSCARGVLGPSAMAERLPDADPVMGALAAELFDYCDLKIATLVGQLAGSDPESLGRIRQEAFSARVTAVLGAMERHTRALSLRDSACLAADQAFVAACRRQAAFAHGPLEPPDFERRRRVPTEALHVSPGIERLDENRVAQDGPTLGIAEFERAVDRTVLLGDRGCGKSTTCQVLMHRRAADPKASVPFLVVLRDFALADAEKRSVVAPTATAGAISRRSGLLGPPGAMDAQDREQWADGPLAAHDAHRDAAFRPTRDRDPVLVHLGLPDLC
ncbi:hypothetical protein [Streptomyces sp. NPDC001530]|uniref:hypothetical protein n=1 Tax=Streptomyces sp. NPDC001530 TaxID=3364582 RepID=UPI0036790A5C